MTSVYKYLFPHGINLRRVLIPQYKKRAFGHVYIARPAYRKRARARTYFTVKRFGRVGKVSQRKYLGKHNGTFRLNPLTSESETADRRSPGICIHERL